MISTKLNEHRNQVKLSSERQRRNVVQVITVL